VIRLTHLLKEDEADDELKSLLRKDYNSFVKELGDNVKDPKFITAIRSLSEKLPIQAKQIQPVVKVLRPTQNEIILDKSLSYPLQDPMSVKTALSGGVVAVAGKSIVTAGGGRFVIDGHHRWSQIYCINPDAKIKALDLPITDPIKALKATQVGIAGQIGKIPKSTGGGVNLFTINEDALKKYVVDTITDQVVQVFKKFNKGGTPEAIANYIWGNVQRLKKDSKPVQGAPRRDVMPQTDDAPKFTDTTPRTDKMPESRNPKLMTLLSIK
jgi:hypothetical protein